MVGTGLNRLCAPHGNRIVPDHPYHPRKRLIIESSCTANTRQYQKLARRYVPEAVSFILRSISLLAPTAQPKLPGQLPYNESDEFRIANVSEEWKPRKPTFADMFAPSSDTPLVILSTFLGLLDRLAEVWDGKLAFVEVFEPAALVLAHLASKESAKILGPELKVSAPHEDPVFHP